MKQMTQSAERLTVLELRELLKSRRQAEKAAATDQTPFRHLPKGLSKMSLEHLFLECQLRQIPLDGVVPMGKKPARAQLILAIREHTEWSKAEERFQQTQGDWPMAGSA